MSAGSTTGSDSSAPFEPNLRFSAFAPLMSIAGSAFPICRLVRSLGDISCVVVLQTGDRNPIFRGVGFTVGMVSRERLLSLGATASGHTRAALEKPAVRLIGRLFALALLVLLALRLWQLWRREPVDFGAVDPGVFAAAVVASVAAVSSYGLVWIFLLRQLGTQAPLSWMTLFFKSQLAKYLPGSVWQYAGRVALAHSRGVPAQRAVVSVAAEIGYSALAAAAVASLVLGAIAASGVFAGLALLLPLGIRLVRPASVSEGDRLDRPSVSAALRAAPAAVG